MNRKWRGSWGWRASSPVLCAGSNLGKGVCGEPGHHVGEGPPDPGRSGSERVRPPRPGLGSPRALGSRTRPGAGRSGDTGTLGCRLRAGKPANPPGTSGAASQRPTTPRFAAAFLFFFFHSIGRSGRFGDRAAPGPPTPPTRGRAGAHARAGTPGAGAARAASLGPVSVATGSRRGGPGRRGPRRLLFLPLPVPRGHVAMATVLLSAAAPRLGWRA